MNIVCLILFVGFGIFNIIAAFCNWDWYFESAYIKKTSIKLGRNLTRVLYAFLGLILCAYGIAFHSGLAF